MPCTRRRGLTLGALTLCFLGQSWLVYADDPGPVRLEGAALDGARLWHEHDCQACHAIYGYGGFMGPDLTNFATRSDSAKLSAWLIAGPGAMPAFELEQQEREALWAWLQAVNATGVGQARALDWWEYE